MSVLQMGMVWRLKLPHNKAWVLMALADHAHDDGSRCFPGVKHIAWKTGYGERQVRRVLHSLRVDTLIEAVAYERGGTRPTEYWLHLDRGVQKAFIRSWGRDDTMSGPPLTGVTQLRPQGDDKKSEPPDPAGLTHDTAKSSEPSVTIIEPSGEPSVYAAWLAKLRGIDGWAAKGETHLGSLLMWIGEKGYTDQQLEDSAIGLAATSAKTLKGYRDMAAAFQRRLNQGYDNPGHGDNGRGARKVSPVPGGEESGAGSGWDNRNSAA